MPRPWTAFCALFLTWSAAADADNLVTTTSTMKMTSHCVSLTQPAGGDEPSRGPGDTGIPSKRSCLGPVDEWEGDPAARSPGCVQFGQTYAGDAVLVNPCAVCRAAVIERIDITGNLSRQAYSVAPRSSVGVATEGLARARIIRDDPCG